MVGKPSIFEQHSLIPAEIRIFSEKLIPIREDRPQGQPVLPRLVPGGAPAGSSAQQPYKSPFRRSFSIHQPASAVCRESSSRSPSPHTANMLKFIATVVLVSENGSTMCIVFGMWTCLYTLPTTYREFD